MIMRKFLIILFLCVSASYTHSQVLISLLFGDKLNSDQIEFGLDGGLNYSNISDFENTKRLRMLNLGFYFDFQLKRSPWNLRTGVMVKSTRGHDDLTKNDLLSINPDFEFEDVEGIYSQRLGYFDVPLLLKYKFKNKVFLELGGQTCLLHSSLIEFNASEGNREERIRTENGDFVNRIDAGILAGAGWAFKEAKGMQLGIWYYHGMTNVYKGITGKTNSALTFKLLIPVGAGKKEKKVATAEDSN